MAALSAAKNRLNKGMNSIQAYLVDGGSIIYKGAIVAVDTNGYLVPAADTASFDVVGVAMETVDNSAGANGAKKCRVFKRGLARFAKSGSFTQSLVGSTTVTVVDDDTVGLAADTTNDIPFGKLVELEDGEVWIEWDLAGSIT